MFTLHSAYFLEYCRRRFQDNMQFIRDNIKQAVGMGKSVWITAKALKKEPQGNPEKYFQGTAESAKDNNKPALIHSGIHGMIA